MSKVIIIVLLLITIASGGTLDINGGRRIRDPQRLMEQMIGRFIRTMNMGMRLNIRTIGISMTMILRAKIIPTQQKYLTVFGSRVLPGLLNVEVCSRVQAFI